MNTIEDETDLIQYGQSDQVDFFDISAKEISDDGYNQDLVENPNGTYAFADVYFEPGDSI